MVNIVMGRNFIDFTVFMFHYVVSGDNNLPRINSFTNIPCFLHENDSNYLKHYLCDFFFYLNFGNGTLLFPVDTIQ